MDTWEWIKYSCIHETTMTISTKNCHSFIWCTNVCNQVSAQKSMQEFASCGWHHMYGLYSQDCILIWIYRTQINYITLHSITVYYADILAVGLLLRPTDGWWTNTGWKEFRNQNATYILFQRHRLHVSEQLNPYEAIYTWPATSIIQRHIKIICNVLTLFVESHITT